MYTLDIDLELVYSQWKITQERVAPGAEAEINCLSTSDSSMLIGLY